MKKQYSMISLGLICAGIFGIFIDCRFTDNKLSAIMGGCGSGPCISYGTGLCGYWHGSSGCIPTSTFACSGDCGVRCQGTEESEFCAGRNGSCTDKVVQCAFKYRPACTEQAMYMCYCHGGYRIGSCSRNDCY